MHSENETNGINAVLLHFILQYIYARYLVWSKMRQRMQNISLYYFLQDFFGHHGCPPELTPALTFHEPVAWAGTQNFTLLRILFSDKVAAP